MKSLKSIVRPSVAIVFILCVIVDLIILPFLSVLLSMPHDSNLSDGFWLSFGGYLSVYAWGRSKEKVAGVEPETLKD